MIILNNLSIDRIKTLPIEKPKGIPANRYFNGVSKNMENDIHLPLL